MTTPLTEILVIDDEVQIRRLLRITLEAGGYSVREAETGLLGLQEAAARRPDAVILDLGLPDMDGITTLQRLRGWSQLPVLILSVRGDETQKIAALDAGADDYLTKPFGGGELLARLRVLLRRAKPLDEQAIARFGQVEVDFARRQIRKGGHEVHLTGKEYALLELLLRHRGKVITHRQLLREVWGENAQEQTQYLRVHMTHLRQKLEDEPTLPRYLRTEAGVGYRFSADD
ncbi:MAG TPA: response regulator [Opitutaceae bacterium]|nr:response regulator [Opitutaceae bacterium]